MIQIPIDSIPNQSFNIQLNGINFNLFIRATDTLMNMDIWASNIPIVLGVRVLPRFPMINYKYKKQGNFIFLTDNDEYPSYTRFDIDQFLLYVTQSELDTIRAIP